MDPIAAVTALATALTAATNEVNQKSALYNTPAMQAALVIHRMQAAIDEQRAQIEAENLEAVRILIAEAV